MLYAGKELADEKTLDECGVKMEAMLHLVLKKKEENMKQLTKFEKEELQCAQSSKLAQFYNASAGLNDEVRDYRDSESKFDSHANPSGEGFDLGRDGQFKEFTVAIGQFYSFLLENAMSALKKKGFRVLHTNNEQEFIKMLPQADVAWIISGSGSPSPALVDAVLAYHHSLGGLLIYGDNHPFFGTINPILAKMFPHTQCTGDDSGGQKMQVCFSIVIVVHLLLAYVHISNTTKRLVLLHQRECLEPISLLLASSRSLRALRYALLLIQSAPSRPLAPTRVVVLQSNSLITKS